MRKPRWFFGKKTEQKETAVSLAERDPNEGFYINFPRDRAIMAHTAASIMIDAIEPGTPEEDDLAIREALAIASFAWAIPRENDPMQYDPNDANMLFTWLIAVATEQDH